MVGSIICGVDESASAQGAARVARRLSGKLGLSLVFVRVVDDGPADEKIDAIAERLGRLTSAASDVDCGAHWLVEVGHPADRLVAVAANTNASMIVVGSHGSRSSLLGSVSADVSRRAPCPVVVVPPGADDRLNDERGLPSRGSVHSDLGVERRRRHRPLRNPPPSGIGREYAAIERGRHELRRLNALGMGGRDAGLGKRTSRGDARRARERMRSLGHGRRTGVSGRGKLRPSRAYRRKVGEAMAANADRRLLVARSGVARRRPRRSRIGDGARARAAAIRVDRIRGPLADRLRSRSGGDTGCATPTCLSARAGNGRRPAHRLLVVADAICSPPALVDAICSKPRRRSRSHRRARPRLSSALSD